MIYKALGFRGLFYSACQEHPVCAGGRFRSQERLNRRNGLSNSRRAVTADLAVCLGSPSHQRQAPQGEQRKSQIVHDRPQFGLR